MPKEIKKCYNYLDLSYSATVEQIEEREKILIKIMRAKAIKTGKSHKAKIQEIANNANILIDYVNENGIPNKKDYMFETSSMGLFTQIFVLISVLILFTSSIIALI